MRTVLSSFGIVFIAELADKSRVVGLLLAATFRAPWRVFLGMTLGYVLLDGAAVALGAWSGARLSSRWVGAGAGALFIAFAAAAWLLPEDAEERLGRRLDGLRGWGPFAVSFLAIALSELGDRTQLAAAALAAETRRPWAVLAGALLALTALNALTVWLGAAIARRLDPLWIRRASAAVFAAAGAALLLRAMR